MTQRTWLITGSAAASAATLAGTTDVAGEG